MGHIYRVSPISVQLYREPYPARNIKALTLDARGMRGTIGTRPKAGTAVEFFSFSSIFVLVQNPRHDPRRKSTAGARHVADPVSEELLPPPTAMTSWAYVAFAVILYPVPKQDGIAQVRYSTRHTSRHLVAWAHGFLPGGASLYPHLLGAMSSRCSTYLRRKRDVCVALQSITTLP
jgi:hypothetical protein